MGPYIDRGDVLSRGIWWSDTRWSAIGATSSKQRQMRWKRQLKPLASTIHRKAMPSKGEGQYKQIVQSSKKQQPVSTPSSLEQGQRWSLHAVPCRGNTGAVFSEKKHSRVPWVIVHLDMPLPCGLPEDKAASLLPPGNDTVAGVHLCLPVTLWLKPLSVQGSGSGTPRKVVSTRKTSGQKRV